MLWGIHRQLRSNDSSKRLQAVEKLEQSGSKHAVAMLIDALRGLYGYRDVPERAFMALVKIGPAAVEPLIAVLEGYFHQDVKKRAVEALVKIGTAAVEPLSAVLKDKDKDNYWDVQSRVAMALGNIGDARAVEPLIAALKDSHTIVQWNVVEALEKIGDARAVNPLIAALKDSYWQVQERAAVALGNIGDAHAAVPLIAALKGRWDLQERAAVALERIGTAAVEPLITALKDKECNVRERAAVALGNIGDARAVTPLLAALKDDHQGVREYATVALGQIRDASAVEPLIANLKDSYWRVQASAIRSLRMLEWRPEDDTQRALYAVAHSDWDEAAKLGTISVEPLIAALEDGGWELSEHGAAIALGKIGGPRALEILIAAFKTLGNNRLDIAAEALVEMGTDAVEPLTTILKDGKYGVEERAIVALGKIGNARAVEPLIAVLENRNKFISAQKAAAVALGKIGDARAVKSLIASLTGRHKEVVECAEMALVEIGTDAVEPLIAVLKDKDNEWPGRRKQAAVVLGKIGNARAVEPLIAMLGDDDEWVRDSSAQSLLLLGWHPNDDIQHSLYAAVLNERDERYKEDRRHELHKQNWRFYGQDKRSPGVATPGFDWSQYTGGSYTPD